MNIREAKREIGNTLRAYHLRDDGGNYRFPAVRQRPILLMGPPGIGKTAILEQIAQECGVGLVAYTMTHHTRQSAIGLPHIETRVYDGREVQVTDYTLSEIIASVHDCMEKTGKREGILFLDEINCVSETLAPTMLQLLQSKTFGSHKIPEGWMIVAAGNPPEYNKSVREFDIVTLDRVRQIEIEADCDVFLDYAGSHGVHGAILSYLSIKPDNFYRIEQTAAAKHFVTARGWEDLSALLRGYEELGVPVTEEVVVQYLQHAATARDFAAYYHLYCKHGADYGIDEILQGTVAEEKIAMAQSGGFEERFTVVNLLLDRLHRDFLTYDRVDRMTIRLHEALQSLKQEWREPGAFDGLGQIIGRRRHGLEVKAEAGLMTVEAEREERWVLRRLEDYDLRLRGDHVRNTEDAFARIREWFAEETTGRKTQILDLQRRLERAFSFLERSFGEGQEMVLFVTGLTRCEAAMGYITRHGCDAYLRRSEVLRIRKQEQTLREACRELL